jgi:spore maturation protein CgeB
VEQFFQPDREILIAHDADDIVSCLHQTSAADARHIGSAMHARALRDHRYESRAKLVDMILQSSVRSRQNSYGLVSA